MQKIKLIKIFYAKIIVLKEETNLKTGTAPIQEPSYASSLL